MNPVVLLTMNNLDLTKRCVKSVREQDIETEVYIFDNASTDGTSIWILSEADNIWLSPSNKGVSKGWNTFLRGLFDAGAEHVLVIGNDTVLAPWTYSALLSIDKPFVTGVDIGMDPLPDKPDILPLNEHPDFSCFLIRREVWEKVGPFDERLVHYCGDCDYHIRAHRLGIPLYKASIPYNHERSSTMNRATPQDRAIINAQADKDRETFHSIYGCLPGSAAYEELFR